MPLATTDSIKKQVPPIRPPRCILGLQCDPGTGTCIGPPMPKPTQTPTSSPTQAPAPTSPPTQASAPTPLITQAPTPTLTPTPSTISEGGTCGQLSENLTAACANGLFCDTANSLTGSGVCRQMPVQEGGQCGGFRVTYPPQCAPGLTCDHSHDPPNIVDGPGICVKGVQQGGVCGGINGAQCAIGLTCEYPTSSVISKVGTGICVPSTSPCGCQQEPLQPVCGVDPISNQVQHYPSRCYAICLNGNLPLNAITNAKGNLCAQTAA